MSEARGGTRPTVLRMRGIEKRFPGVQALDAADLSIDPSEVHGLVGENGAGKSTIIKILAGVYERDEGTIEIGGQAVPEVTPQAVHDLGVRFIHQELHLVPHFTVAESVFMGNELRGRVTVRRRHMQQRAGAFLRDVLGADIAPQTLIRDLGPAERKLVQVARALIDEGAQLVVFDEPTAPLASAEVERVFAAISGLRAQGIASLYVSHYLGEVTEICDRVTVFRNGTDVGVLDDIDDGSARELIRLMVGRDIGDMFPAREARPGSAALRLDGLDGGTAFAPTTLSIARGEILGLAGLLGSGREELVDTIVGLRAPRGGRIEVAGHAERLRSPADALDHGIVLVPRDRRQDGLVLDMDVASNINLATLEQVSRFGWIHRGPARRRAKGLVDRMDVRPADTRPITRLLSGGNQQKVVLGRWLAADAQVYILDEPTVGVDVGAKAEIYKLVADLADEGAGVLISSNDPGELLGVCDRIAVMLRGEIVTVVDVAELDRDRLVALTTGGSSTVADAAGDDTPQPTPVAPVLAPDHEPDPDRERGSS